MIVTNNDKIAEDCRGLRNICFNKKRRFSHDQLGWNFRMTNFQAAIGLAQLEDINKKVKKKDLSEIFIIKSLKIAEILFYH